LRRMRMFWRAMIYVLGEYWGLGIREQGFSGGGRKASTFPDP
jgi:hypothetical protein